jgi:hypothetical protein
MARDSDPFYLINTGLSVGIENKTKYFGDKIVEFFAR